MMDLKIGGAEQLAAVDTLLGRVPHPGERLLVLLEVEVVDVFWKDPPIATSNTVTFRVKAKDG